MTNTVGKRNMSTILGVGKNGYPYLQEDANFTENQMIIIKMKYSNTKIILLPYFFLIYHQTQTNNHFDVQCMESHLVPKETQVWTAIYVTNVLINCMNQLIFSIQLMKFQIKMTCES